MSTTIQSFTFCCPWGWWVTEFLRWILVWGT